MNHYITAPKAARVLDLPLWRVYELCRMNVLPHARLRRQIRIDPERLKAFMDAGGAPLKEFQSNAASSCRGIPA
jgi:excisionase family DNA binding protein